MIKRKVDMQMCEVPVGEAILESHIAREAHGYMLIRSDLPPSNV